MSFKKEEVDTKFGDIAFVTDDYEELVILPLPDVDGKVQGVAVLSLGPSSVKTVIAASAVIAIGKSSPYTLLVFW